VKRITKAGQRKLSFTGKQEQQITHAYLMGFLLYECKGCGVKVHSQCFGKAQMPELNLHMPKPTDIDWICTVCDKLIKGGSPSKPEELQCEVCLLKNESKEGFKNMVGGQFCHLFCAMWFAQLTVKDSEK